MSEPEKKEEQEEILEGRPDTPEDIEFMKAAIPGFKTEEEEQAELMKELEPEETEEEKKAKEEAAKKQTEVKKEEQTAPAATKTPDELAAEIIAKAKEKPVERPALDTFAAKPEENTLLKEVHELKISNLKNDILRHEEEGKILRRQYRDLVENGQPEEAEKLWEKMNESTVNLSGLKLKLTDLEKAPLAKTTTPLQRTIPTQKPFDEMLDPQETALVDAMRLQYPDVFGTDTDKLIATTHLKLIQANVPVAKRVEAVAELFKEHGGKLKAEVQRKNTPPVAPAKVSGGGQPAPKKGSGLTLQDVPKSYVEEAKRAYAISGMKLTAKDIIDAYKVDRENYSK